MAITKISNDLIDLNQTGDFSGLRLPEGTTADREDTFTADYLVVGGAGAGGGMYRGGGGGAGGLRTSYNNSTTTTNSLSFPAGKTAIATYMLDVNATDISGNYNGTSSYITYNTGKYGGGAVFNGSSSIISPTQPTLSGGFTLSAWVKTISTNFSSIITMGGVNGVAGAGLNMFMYNNKLYSSWGTGSTEDYFTTPPTTVINTGEWFHLVLSTSGLASGSTVKAYVNGNLEATETSSVAIDTTTYSAGFAFGARNLGGTLQAYFDGSIDQIRIYATELSGTDVTNIYTNEVQANSGGGTAAESSVTLLAGTSYGITVGDGGIGVFNNAGGDGGNSVFNTITSDGGGGGSEYSANSGRNGGSGGGSAGYSSTTGSGGLGTPNQGYAGGQGNGGGPQCGGGGGGASTIGKPGGSGATDGDGGDGINISILNSTNAAAAGIGEIIGTDVWYSGGAGGGNYGTGNITIAGKGGGAAGASGSSPYTSGPAGTSNTGGAGGGGNGETAPAGYGGNGGSGIVILRYPTASVTGFTVTGTLNTPSTTDTIADNNYPTTNLAYYKLDGNANGYLTTNDLNTVNYPAGAGCIALYEMNGNAADTGNTYNGTATNVTYDTGAFDQAAVLDGSAVAADIVLGSTFISAFDVSNKSFSLWFNWDGSNPGSNGYGMLFFMVGSGLSNGRIGAQVTNSNGTLTAFAGTSSSAPTTTILANTWYHFALVVSGGSYEAFVNGSSIGTDTADSYTDAGTDTAAIGSYFSSNYYFCGKVDQVRFFSDALSNAEVTTLARGAGTAYNAVPSNVTWGGGRFKEAAVFDGASNGSQILIPDAAAFSPANNDLSFSVWINTTSTAGAYVLSKQNDSTGTYEIQFFMNSNGTLQLALYTSGGSGVASVTTTATVNDGNWHHVVFVIDTNTSVAVYVDTVGVTSSSWSGTMSDTATDVGLGFGGTGMPGNRLNGSLDQVRFFASTISESQITELYNESYQTKFTEGSDTVLAFTKGTGAVTFSGTSSAPPSGAIRYNTTTKTVEFYNGAWVEAASTKYCTTNTLNFPQGTGCTASYNLDDNVNDINNVYNGTAYNITYASSGKFGAAVIFNGSNGYVTTPYTPPLTTAATISLWINFTAYTNPYALIAGDNNSGSTNLSFLTLATGAAAGYGGNGHLWVSIGDQSGGYDINTSQDFDNYGGVGSWIHVAVTVNGTSVNIYMNGALATSYTSSISYAPTSGAYPYSFGYISGWNYLNAKLDQIRFFDAALTADQVGELYNNETEC